MNIILLEDADFSASDLVRLSGRRANHINHVLKAKPGDSLRIGQIHGLRGNGTVIETRDGEVTLQIALDQEPPTANNIGVLLALPRPKILHRTLRMLAELGVKDIVLLNSWRVEKSYWQSPLLANEKITECFKLGLEQAGDTVMPTLRLEKRFKPFVEDDLAAWLGTRAGIVGHPSALARFDTNLQQRLMTQQCVLAIGPEGGFIPYEIDALEQAGFDAFSLGERPLRVDTVLPYLLGALHTSV